MMAAGGAMACTTEAKGICVGEVNGAQDIRRTEPHIAAAGSTTIAPSRRRAIAAAAGSTTIAPSRRRAIAPDRLLTGFTGGITQNIAPDIIHAAVDTDELSAKLIGGITQRSAGGTQLEGSGFFDGSGRG